VAKLYPNYVCIAQFAGLQVGPIPTFFFYFCGISKTSFYRIIWKTMKAIAKCRDECIKISFPKTLEQCKEVAAGFRSVSTMGCIQECVAAVDGYLLAINAPSKKQGKNVRFFFLGTIKSME
jgi:hypothetical protein